jgi:uncharacterized protein YjbI with pentapeptide repeats
VIAVRGSSGPEAGRISPAQALARGLDLAVRLAGVAFRAGADVFAAAGLRGVVLRGVVLRGVVLRGVVLRGVVLRGVALRAGADGLAGARFATCTGWVGAVGA